MAVRIDLSRVNFPAAESCLDDQQKALCLMRSTMEANRSFFVRPNNSGNPRYFPAPPSFSMPSVCLTQVLSSCSVFAEKEIDDLLVFIICPDARSYFCRISFRAKQLWGLERTKNNVSSANKR